MNIIVFGNPNHPQDSLALKVSKKLVNFKSVSFQTIDPNGDLPLSPGKGLVILDAVMGIDKVTLFTEKDIGKLVLPPRTSIHDYDLGFQLKYLKKIGRLKNIRIIGLPMNGNVDYDLIHSILRKLVAQDMQGS